MAATGSTELSAPDLRHAKFRSCPGVAYKTEDWRKLGAFEEVAHLQKMENETDQKMARAVAV